MLPVSNFDIDNYTCINILPASVSVLQQQKKQHLDFRLFLIAYYLLLFKSVGSQVNSVVSSTPSSSTATQVPVPSSFSVMVHVYEHH